MDGHPFTFFTALGAPEEVLHVVTGVFVGILIVLGVAVLYPRLRRAADNVVPEKRVTMKGIVELFLDMLISLCDDVIGKGGRRYAPFAGSIFLFLFVANLVGLIPGFLPPTENWVTGAALGTISFLAYNYFGFRERGFAYLTHFLAPVGPGPVRGLFRWIVILLPVLLLQMLFAAIEVFSSVFRPVTLSIRLYVNIFADHKMLEVFASVVAYFLPVAFMFFGVFVAFMQAFIFTVLSMVYISGAVAHEH